LKSKELRLPAIYLASQSPRRRDLLRSAGLNPIVIAPDVDDDPEQLERAQPSVWLWVSRIFRHHRL